VLRDLASRDSRVRVFSPGRLGITGAANYGLTQARGEYIARQDFVDRSYPDRLRLQVEFLDTHPEVGVVGGYYLLVDENRGERYMRMPPTEHSGILPAMARSIPFANTIVAFRRRVWVEAGGYPHVADLEDLRLWLQAAKLGWRFANIPEVLGEHYVHPTSFFHRSFRYIDRQRHLARVQAQVVRELGLPKWMYLFAAGRYFHAYCPTTLSRVLRDTLHRHYLWLVACPIWTGALLGPNRRVASEAFFGISEGSFCTESGDPPEMPSRHGTHGSVYV